MNQLLHQYLHKITVQYGDRIAFRFFERGGLVSVSYRQFVQDIHNAAAGFQEYRDRHIAILARNSYAYIVNLLGIMAADAVAVTLNIEEGWEVLREQIELADIHLILHDGEYLADHSELGEYNHILHTLSLPDAYNPAQQEVYENPDALALLMFTSGTTSIGKCVMLPHRCFWENGKCLLPQEKVDRCFFCNPLFHISGICSLFGWLRMGCTLCINSDIRFLRKELILYGCDLSFFVPKVIEFLYRHVRKGKLSELGKLKYIVSGGAYLEPDVIRNFSSLDIPIIRYYALSETAGWGTTNTLSSSKLSSVGLADPGVKISIQDGEICLKGDCIMLGYYKNPEATAQALQDGWLHTGDLGYLDEDGYLYITGRKKNLIILSTGENVNPEELEGLLLRCPDIMETIVAEKNAKICAQIYAAEDKQEAIRRFVDETNKQVAIYKRINLIEFRTEPFPRTASGKIKRT